MEKVRKLMEIVFRSMGIQARISAGKETPDAETTRKAKGVAIVVEGNGATYADTLREIRTKLTDRDTINSIKGVRRTANGNLLMMMSDTEGQTRKKVEEALAGRKVRIVGGTKEKTVRVRDIDTLQSEEDVARVLEESLATQRDKIVNKSLKPTADGNQVATVTLETNLANRLIRKGKVRIGLSLCRVQERVAVLKCYKCWSYGHKAQGCNGPDRSKSCQRCAGEGHLRQQCDREAYCPLCDQGHEAGTSRCHVFQKALADARPRQND